ncbi:hypothetical protein DID78_02465 [Candidatus Marinamargulisbacteria bacterium SCGC AG-343-D04]|nr:hypothetical protein DID78_02465 [Candidatus Marinamargulisbacteria bacterium SCGC AG-343-D04]
MTLSTISHLHRRNIPKIDNPKLKQTKLKQIRRDLFKALVLYQIFFNGAEALPVLDNRTDIYGPTHNSSVSTNSSQITTLDPDVKETNLRTAAIVLLMMYCVINILSCLDAGFKLEKKHECSSCLKESLCPLPYWLNKVLGPCLGSVLGVLEKMGQYSTRNIYVLQNDVERHFGSGSNRVFPES